MSVVVRDPGVTERVSLRVSDVRHHAFCPRVLWHRLVLGHVPRETPKMALGRDAEGARAVLERRRQPRRYGLDRGTRRFSVQLASESLGLHGICDLVIDVPDAAGAATSYAVDVKTTRGGVGRHHVLQLTAYAVMLEESGSQRTSTGFVVLLPQDRVEVVDVGAAARERLRRELDTIRSMLSTGRFPEPTRYRSFCPDCEHVNFCGDVL